MAEPAMTAPRMRRSEAANGRHPPRAPRLRGDAADPPAADPAPMRLSGYFELENLETPEITAEARERPSVGRRLGAAGDRVRATRTPDCRPRRPPADGRVSTGWSSSRRSSRSSSRRSARGRRGTRRAISRSRASGRRTPSRPTARPSSREIPRATVPPAPVAPPTERRSPTPAPPRPASPAPPPAARERTPPEVDVRRSAIDALRVEEVLPPRSPTPPSVRAVTPRSPVPAFTESPAVRTPAALEALKELEPWARLGDGAAGDRRRHRLRARAGRAPDQERRAARAHRCRRAERGERALGRAPGDHADAAPLGRVLARVEVRGRVQGVGFRWFARESARRHGLAGWVRNRDDGGVEVAASGPPEAVERFLGELRRGPAGARVDDLVALPVEGLGDARRTLHRAPMTPLRHDEPRRRSRPRHPQRDPRRPGLPEAGDRLQGHHGRAHRRGALQARR